MTRRDDCRGRTIFPRLRSDAGEEREARSVHELEAEQGRLSARTYELDAELRHRWALVDRHHPRVHAERGQRIDDQP